MTDRMRLCLVVTAAAVIVNVSLVTAESSTNLLKAGKYSEAYEQAAQEPGAKKDAVANLARDLLEVACESPDQSQRWSALRATRFAPDPHIIPSLRRIAREGDRYEQSLALDGLLVAASRDAREELIQAIGSNYRPVRVRGLRGLIDQADASLVPTFAHLLATEEDPSLRALAARGLGRTGSEPAIAALRRALHDPSEAVQDEVVQGLAALHHDELAATLAECLARATETAERIRWIRLMRYLRDEQNIEVLAPTLQDPDPQVRTYGAASILAILNHTERKP